MNIVVINGTEVRGCTYQIKEAFLSELREHRIQEFYLPKDCPSFCIGCKKCFFEGEEACPHTEKTMPIWNAMLTADVIVFAYPVYVMRAPGQIKTLLDHFACHYMVHRPKVKMFTKSAVILTQSIGAPNGAAQKDVATTLSWLGISDVKKVGFGLIDSIYWDELSHKRKTAILKKVKRVASRYKSPRRATPNLATKLKFMLCKKMQKEIIKKGQPLTLDNRYWVEQGWL